MVRLAFKDNCTGCTACYNICPKQAITMRENEEGFLYPVIEEKLCIECGKCAQVCPVLAPEYDNLKPVCYAAYAKNEIRMKSSSGGIFTILAKEIINQGGWVCGAAYDENFNVKHILVDQEDELEKIRGSKYVQSDIGHMFMSIKEKLDCGETVLFTGLPCQVAGLKKYLNKDYVQLVTVDLFCHGVPSPKSYHKYLDAVASGKKIIDVNFRNKENYGWSSSSTISFEDGTQYKNSHKNDLFYNAFLPCMSVRKSCGTCMFSHIPRQSDISIGDYWGVEKYIPELNDGKGVSAVLVNNEKGKALWEKIEGDLEKAVSAKLEDISVGNPTLCSPFHPHPGRKHFFSVPDILPFKKAVANSLQHHYDVGVVGLWYGINYGSILTYYALYEVIRSLGYDPIFLAKPNKLWTEKFNDSNTVANKFIRPRCNVSNPRDDKDWNQMNNHCDTFILGADVIWNYEICGKDAGQYFFLDFVDSDKKKIAYSSSFGSGYHAPEKERRKSQYYLKRFDYVAVREQEGIRICKEKFEVEATQVLDPVFLLSEDFYRKIVDEIILDENERYITTYLLSVNEKKRELVIKLSEQLGVGQRNFVDPNLPERGEAALRLPVVKNVSVEKWLYYVANSEFFVGDSFHGLCFALIFKKPFICIVNRTDKSKVRFESLLKICGLENRLLYTDEDYISKIDEILKPIDYDAVYAKLNSHIEFSRNWLKNALETPKITKYSEMEIFEEQIREIAELERRIRLLENNLDEFKRTIDDDVRLKRWIKRNIKRVGKKVWGEIKKKL